MRAASRLRRACAPTWRSTSWVGSPAHRGRRTARGRYHATNCPPSRIDPTVRCTRGAGPPSSTGSIRWHGCVSMGSRPAGTCHSRPARWRTRPRASTACSSNDIRGRAVARTSNGSRRSPAATRAAGSHSTVTSRCPSPPWAPRNSAMRRVDACDSGPATPSRSGTSCRSATGSAS